MAYRFLATFALTAAIVHAQAVPAPAPKPAPAPASSAADDEDPVFRASTEEVIIPVLIRGKKDALVKDLKIEDFELKESGKKQTLTGFTKESNLPLTIALMIDVSESLNAYIQREQEAAFRFLERILRPTDQALVGAFRTQTILLQDTTNELGKLQAGLHKLDDPLSPSMGTVLYDAVKLVADKRLRETTGRKVMVVMTDGMDYGSQNSLQAALESAQRADAMIYVIAFPLDPRLPGSCMSTAGQGLQGVGMGGVGQAGIGGDGVGCVDRVMHKFADDTGGRVFTVGGGTNLDPIFDEIEDEVRSQYLLSYTPTNTKKDGKYRKIEVKVKGNPRVQAPLGYYAREEKDDK